MSIIMMPGDCARYINWNVYSIETIMVCAYTIQMDVMMVRFVRF